MSQQAASADSGTNRQPSFITWSERHATVMASIIMSDWAQIKNKPSLDPGLVQLSRGTVLDHPLVRANQTFRQLNSICS